MSPYHLTNPTISGDCHSGWNISFFSDRKKMPGKNCPNDGPMFIEE